MATTAPQRRSTTAPTRPGGSSKFTQRKVSGYLVTALTWVLVFIFIFPVLWMIITSFKTEADAAAFPPSFSSGVTLDRYADVFAAAWGCTC